MYTRALDAPFRMQWDSDSRLPLPSPGSAPNNCGPTSVTNIAHFYRDYRYGIYLTRRLAVTDPYRATSITEQKVMLEKRGVPCDSGRPSLATIKSLISSRRRPIVLGLYMAAVPLNVAGHPFRGWHAVEALENATYSGASGVLIRDPNFSTYTKRLDPTGGKRFYPDWVIQAAFVNQNGWALIPNAAKLVSLPDTSTGTILADGDPAPMRYRSLVNQDTGALPRRTIRAGKPVRKGATVGSAVWTTVPSGKVIRPFGYIDKDDLPLAERVYGDVFLTNWYAVNGEHIGYVKSVDLY